MPDAHAVTVLLTLRDRLSMTRRWLEYLRVTDWRTPVVIADGSVEEDASATVSAFCAQNPAIPVTYQRHIPDTGIKVFVEKVIKALESMSTPWVMLTDNDDFIVEAGLHQAVETLVRDGKLIGCRGRTVYFRKRPGPFSLFEFENRWDALAPKAADRLLNHASNYAPTWYCVMDRATAIEIWKGMRDFPSDDAGFLELYQTTMLVASGRVAWGKFAFLLRQHDGDKASTQIRTVNDQLSRMLQDPAWSATSRLIINRVAERIAARDGCTPEQAFTSAVESCRRIVEAILVRQGVIRALGRSGGMRWMASALMQRYWVRWVLSPMGRTVGGLSGPRSLAHGFGPARPLIAKDWSRS